jgi:hypothetical protein
MSTIFQMGSGDTAFIMDKVEVSQGKFDNFLGMVGATLRYHGTQGIRFAGCLIGQDKEYAQLLANKLGVRADFDEDFLGFGDRGTYSAYRRAHGTSARGFHPREETVRRTGELVGPQRQAYPQQAGDPQL